MKWQRKSREYLEDYSRRIEEVFRKHGDIPKKVYGKGYKAFFLNKNQEEDTGKSITQ